MGPTWSQFFPPDPKLTESNLPRQDGKVFIVTGGASGVGYELCTIFYQAGGKVYLAGRSEPKAQAAIAAIQALPSTAPGELAFLPIQLDDLATIKPAVEQFLAAESRLDVLFNNAGVSNPPQGSVGAQGHDLQLATNCFGPYLLTQLLVPILTRTAQATTPGAVRVVWTSSVVTDLSSPHGGFDLAELTNPSADPQKHYVISKTGNWFLADALAKQAGKNGVLSVTQNPGNLKTALTRHLPRIVPLLASPLLYHSRMGAYTELWAGLSSDLLTEDGGKYIVPWGRLHPSPRQDLLDAMKTEEEGGTGLAAMFVEYCERETVAFRYRRVIKHRRLVSSVVTPPSQ
jgi:NAD(P)-dependent dehydrogenase (short-subunit alcohol dehydrogenase family)